MFREQQFSLVVEFDNCFASRLQIGRRREINFVKNQYIGILYLCLIEWTKHFAQAGELWNVDHSHHGTHFVAASHGLVRKRLDHLLWFGYPRGFNYTDVNVFLVIQFLNGVDQRTLQSAAQASRR